MLNDDSHRWQAVTARDSEADGAFVFAVATTGVYCRPSCPARRPKRKNVHFFALANEARAAGYRACKRCRPDEMSTAQRAALMVEAACRTLEAGPATLDALAAEAGMSPHHFHRTFKAHTGLTPRAYRDAVRARHTAATLAVADNVTSAAYDSGFAGLSTFYDALTARTSLTPSALRARGLGEVLVVVQRSSSLGVVTAVFSRRGIAAVRLTDDAEDGRMGVETAFANALLFEGDASFENLMDEVVAAVEEPTLAAELPLDIRGTAFEERVWAALRQIPVGTTQSYADIARAIEAPSAHRAVARACGANNIAVLIPCHRVVRSDGSLAGYRWGVERKAALIAAERTGVAADAGRAAVDA